MGVRRIYVEKKPDFAIRAKELLGELRNYLGLNKLDNVRVLVRYDIENISDKDYEKSLGTIFSEPPLDTCYESEFSHLEDDFFFTVEYLPGQFDQRADSAIQCVKLLGSEDDINIRSATTYVFSGEFSEVDKESIRKYCINPVDSRVASESIPKTLKIDFEMPKDLPRICSHQAKQGQHILVTMPKTVQNTDDDREGCRQDNQDNLGQNPIAQPQDQNRGYGNGRDSLDNHHHRVNQVIEPS